MNNKILPVFLPFEGCNNKCIFCNQHSITKISSAKTMDEIQSQIKRYLQISSEWEQIAFYGGSFTCLDKEKRYAFYKLAKDFKIESVRFSTRPDCIEISMLDEFKFNNVDTVELGIQTLDNKALSMNARTYKKNDVIDVIDMLKGHVEIVAQLMPGIYGETFDTFTNGTNMLKKTEISAVRLYPCIVLRNTQLANLYLNKVYKPLELWEAIMQTGFAYVNFEYENIRVIRMGLPIDVDDEDIISGPIHNAFGDLVKTFILLLFCKTNSSLKLPLQMSGYKSLVRQKFPNKFTGSTNDNIWEIIIKNVREQFFEDNRWYLQRQTIEFAKECQSTSDNR